MYAHLCRHKCRGVASHIFQLLVKTEKDMIPLAHEFSLSS